MSQKQTQPISVLILLLFSSFASFAAVLPTPALPAIASYFHITAARSELTMSIYLLGYALGQLIYGPLANWLGRKPALRIGITIAIFSSVMGLLAPYCHNFTLFIITRLLLALGSAATLVISMILIKDSYDEVNARKTFAKVVLSFAMVPFLATALGGFLTHYFSWQAINAVMILYSCILLYFTTNLTETLPKANRQSLNGRYLFSSYRNLLKNTAYLRLVLLFTLGTATSYLFNALSPIIAIKTMHITPSLYGYLSIIPSVGILLGGWIGSRFAHQLKAEQIIFYGASLVLLAGLLMTILFAVGKINLVSLYCTAVIIFCGSSMITPNASMQALTHVSDHANGVSVMNASGLATVSILVNLTGGFIESSVLTLPIALTCLGIIGVIVLTQPLRHFVLLLQHRT